VGVCECVWQVGFSQPGPGPCNHLRCLCHGNVHLRGPGGGRWHRQSSDCSARACSRVGRLVHVFLSLCVRECAREKGRAACMCCVLFWCWCVGVLRAHACVCVRERVHLNTSRATKGQAKGSCDDLHSYLILRSCLPPLTASGIMMHFEFVFLPQTIRPAHLPQVCNLRTTASCDAPHHRRRLGLELEVPVAVGPKPTSSDDGDHNPALPVLEPKCSHSP
jgi:hypothetical protein